MPGQYPAAFSVVDSLLGTNRIHYLENGKRVLLRYPCSSNDCTPYRVTFHPGRYKIELWGAASFLNSTFYSSGAYAAGIIRINVTSSFYIYIGQHGSDECNRTFNGGAECGTGGTRPRSGGGASDMRLQEGRWDDFAGLKSRTIVAGGAGGLADHADGFLSSHGGAFEGILGEKTKNYECMETRCVGSYCEIDTAGGGSQTSGGKGSSTYIYGTGSSGIFGMGTSRNTGNLWCISGGGGGYYGGGNGASAVCVITNAGGGSSFVSGLEGCNAISKDSSDFNSIIHTNQPVHYSKIAFINPVMLPGNDTRVPHQPFWKVFDDGAAQITLLDYYPETADRDDPLSMLFQWTIFINMNFNNDNIFHSALY